MYIFDKEKEDGLEKAISQNNSVAYTSMAKASKTDKKLSKSIAKQIKMFGANPNQKDLFYLESILASVGQNKNKDLFLKEELWKARKTPEDKPFNFMHDESDIIGHLTSSYAVTKEGIIIQDNEKLEDLPDEFDIVTGAVLYKYWADASRKERMHKIIASIESNEDQELEETWYVSMECLFPKFDYALTKASGECTIVERNENTSFLTKYLSAYGGSGNYDGCTISRVLRDFFFSGKGLVNNPANPESLILRSSAKLQYSYANTINLTNTENNMSQDNSVSLEKFQELQKELAAAKAVAQESVEKEMKNLKAQIATLTEENKSVAKELEDVSKLAESNKAQAEEAAKDLETAVAQLEEAKANLSKMEEQNAKAARVSELVEVGLDKDSAEALVASFASIDDEGFQAIKAMKKEVIEAKKASSTNVTDEEKAAAAKLEKTKKDEEAAKAAELLESSSASEDATLNTTTNNQEKLEQVRASVASWFTK